MLVWHSKRIGNDMKFNRMGQTDQFISELCLGTMTFGTQTPEEDAFRQMDLAVDTGINIFDTAEMYPVNPISKQTQGDSERIIGKWLQKSGKRSKVLLATKVAGDGMKLIRNGAPISSKTIPEAVEASLQLLQTDYIDLYQLHWPNRGSYMFRQNWTYNPTRQNREQTVENMEDVLTCLDGLVKEGKIRYVGLSNESAWGTSQWLRIANEKGLPRMQILQNEYSMLCRLFDLDLGELAHNEKVGLLAYSPLATGLLTGKYKGGTTIPKGSRMSLQAAMGGRATPKVWPAIEAYDDIAKKYRIDLPLMALAWCRYRYFMASAIFGATTCEQLTYLLKSTQLTLPDECLEDIDMVNKAYPMPY